MLYNQENFHSFKNCFYLNIVDTQCCIHFSIVIKLPDTLCYVHQKCRCLITTLLQHHLLYSLCGAFIPMISSFCNRKPMLSIPLHPFCPLSSSSFWYFLVPEIYTHTILTQLTQNQNCYCFVVIYY